MPRQLRILIPSGQPPQFPWLKRVTRCDYLRGGLIRKAKCALIRKKGHVGFEKKRILAVDCFAPRRCGRRNHHLRSAVKHIDNPRSKRLERLYLRQKRFLGSTIKQIDEISP